MGGEAPSYGGTDVAVAVDALARTASTLQADLRSERRANEAFREGVTREQRRMRKHLEGLPLGDAELAEEGARTSYAAGAGRRHENGASSSSWSVTRGTSFALTLMTVAVVVLVAYAAATGGGSRGLAGGVAALSGRARADKDTAGSAVSNVPRESRLERRLERGVAALRAQNEEMLKRLKRTSLDPATLLSDDDTAIDDVDDDTSTREGLVAKPTHEPFPSRREEKSRVAKEIPMMNANAPAKRVARPDPDPDADAASPDLAFRVSLASRAASAFAEDMELDARWTRRAVARLQGHAEKMTKLDEALRARAGSSRRIPRKDVLDVRAGVETVRSWEEKIAARFAESRARAREALDVLETLETLAAEAKARGPIPSSSDANELESTRADLEEKRAALRLAADRDAEVSGDADAALTSLRAAILKVMTAVVGDRGEGASAAKRDPEPSRAKTLALLGAFAEAANAATAATAEGNAETLSAWISQPALGDAEPQSSGDDEGEGERRREASSLGDWYTGEPSFEPYLAGGPGSFSAGSDAFSQPVAGARVVPVAPAGYAYRPDDAATRETVAWAGDMANKLEMAEAAAEAAEEAGRAATERAADAAEAATAEARREVRAAEAAEAKAKKEAAEAKKEAAKALRSATEARNELVSSRAEARAAEALLRNESGRAMEEIQAARDAIKAESARSAAAVAAAKEAEAAIPDEAARLAKREVDHVKKRAESKMREARASAEAVRGEIEHEVERELAGAQAKIDEAREAEAEAERRREEALEEKREAVRAAAAATRLETAAEEELAHLLELREKHESEVAMSGKEAARLERILADRVATAEDVSAEAGVAARERARIEARAAEAENLVRDAREDLEEATREKSALDAKIDDAAAVVRSREDDAERSESKLRKASSEAKQAGERVRRSEKKLERVADDALDAEAETLLDEVEQEDKDEEASSVEDDEDEDENEEASSVEEEEDEEASSVEEDEDEDEDEEASSVEEDKDEEASSVEEEEDENENEEASSVEEEEDEEASSVEEDEDEDEDEEASSVEEEEEEEEASVEEASLPSKKHSKKSSSKRRSRETSSAKTNGASSSWTREENDARDASADAEDLLAEWHDDYEDVAEAGDEPLERDDADEDDEWRLSDFDPPDAPKRERSSESRIRSRRSRRAKAEEARASEKKTSDAAKKSSESVLLATLRLSDVAPISFGSLERAALADVLAAFLAETAPEACPAGRGVVAVGAAAPASRAATGAEFSQTNSRALARLGRRAASGPSARSARKALRDDARARASGLAGLEANARLDEGVAVEVACASRDEDADGETKTAKPGRGEAFAAAPRAAAKALGAGAASGALRAAMVEAGFRVGERVDVVGA